MNTAISTGVRAVLTALVPLATLTAQAATLTVGADQTYKLPSEAARMAKAGDTIRIATGTYLDCAVWTADDLLIEGDGAGTIVTGPICGDKALFIIRGNNTVVRNITFAAAAGRASNGAGIRAEGRNLTVEDSVFDHDQDGILAGRNPQSTILIRHSTFEGNGACEPNAGCAHAVYVGQIGLLRIEHSRFADTKIGHDIKSRAARTEIVDTTIEDGPEGTSSYLVDLPNGGSLVLSGNTLEKGSLSSNPVAVAIGEEGVTQPIEVLSIEDNVFANDGAQNAVFVRNATPVAAQLRGNSLKGHATAALSGPGRID
ncbi:MAG: right-handed parallel beta-helix repeat-containing protein [Alphaproteobacteria bacterium]|nr:right-handed parallel beta-helix repeat-containing protein [Alphaproteobacteria bacterium]